MFEAVLPNSTKARPEGTTCRLCGDSLNDGGRLVLNPAPAGAQHFLDAPDSGRGDSIALTVVQCSACGLVQSASRPVDYYRSVITAAGLSPAMRAHRRAQADAFAANFGLAGKRVVEIGCHAGYFLEILAEAGMQPTGTEWEGGPNTAAGHVVAGVYPAPGAAIPGAPFASFFCLNFLEHAPDPRGFLAGIRENLAPDAVGLVEVPNYAQQRRLDRVFDYIADHLSYFDTDTLSLTLTLSGFEVKSVRETRGGENLEAWVRMRRRVDFAEEAGVINTAQTRLTEWLAQQRAANVRTAIWGASHQALTLLACLHPGDVSGIFDSAPFKQGRFAPVTRLPILKPSNETLAGVDCVLIVAAGYELEIAATLRDALKFPGMIYLMSATEIIAL